MKGIRKLLIGLSVIFSLMVLTTPEVNSQCPMCRMSAESNLKEGGSAGKGLNKGIFVLLFTPYLVVGAIGYTWYRNHRKRKLEES
ncbi:MAG TPA: hypothetical protein VJ951_12310 [Bacteroidales bacterium]|nr:hypothetical protein [Bacteroidales bacterium]